MSRPTSLDLVSTLVRKAAWAPLGVLVLHHLLAARYGHEPTVDPWMHFLGGAAIAYVAWVAVGLAEPLLGVPRPAGRALLALSLAANVALAWEMSEFAKRLLYGGELSTGLANTMRDLVCGIAGAALVLAWLRAGALTGRPVEASLRR